MLTENKEREDKKRERMAKTCDRDIGRKRINKVYEEGFHQRKHDKSLYVSENIARSKAQSKERKEAYWGIDDHRELTVVRREREREIEDELASLKARAEACKPNISNRARRKLRQSRQQRRDRAMGAIQSPGEKEKSTSVKESALHERRDERLRLQDENFHLVCEIRKLEAKRSRRWNELVVMKKWDDHENDAVVKELDYDIENMSLKQLKVWYLLQDCNEKWDRFMKMVDSDVPPPKSKKAETKPEDEELDYLFLLKVRKGRIKCSSSSAE